MSKEFEKKSQAIAEQIKALNDWLIIKRDHHKLGLISTEQFSNCLSFAEEKNDEIEADIAVLELLTCIYAN